MCQDLVQTHLYIVVPLHILLVVTFMGSLPTHRPVRLFQQSLFVGTVIIFLTAALGMAGGPRRYVMRVRVETALVE